MTESSGEGRSEEATSPDPDKLMALVSGLLSDISDGSEAEVEQSYEETTGSRIDDHNFTFGGMFFPGTRRDEWGERVPSVPVEIKGGDSDFSHDVRLGDGRVLGEMISHPIANKERILERQSVLRALIASGSSRRLRALLEKTKQLEEGFFELFERKELEQTTYGKGRSYQLYDEYTKGAETIVVKLLDEDDYGFGFGEQGERESATLTIDVKPAVEQAVEKIQAGIDSVLQLAVELGQIDHTAVRRTTENLRDLAEKAKGVVTRERVLFEKPIITRLEDRDKDGPNYPHHIRVNRADVAETVSEVLAQLPGYGVKNSRYSYDESHGGREFAWVATVSERLEDIESVLEIVGMIEAGNWQEVTFDEDQPEHYRSGWHLRRGKKGQVFNDSVDDKPVTVLAAANGSGKTFYMESDLYKHIVAQSTGYAPVEDGNFHIYDSFAFLGRVSSTGGYNNRGAFISEMVRWRDVLGEMGQKPYVYIDEGASTTSPEEQTNFLIGLGAYISSRGGRVMLATHNELVADVLGGMDGGMIYYFDYYIDEETGKLVCSHKMIEGKSDSQFIAMARARRFPDHLLAVMEDYIAGNFKLPDCETARLLPKVEAYTDEERVELMSLGGGIGYMFPQKAENSLFVLLSEDKGAHSSGMEGLDPVIFKSAPLNVKEILERQRSLKLLVDGEEATTLETAVEMLRRTEGLVDTVELNRATGLNRALNPILNEKSYDPFRDYSEASVEPTKAVAYLRLNQILLGDDSRWQRTINILREKIRPYERLQDDYGALMVLRDEKRVLADRWWQGQVNSYLGGSPPSPQEGKVEDQSPQSLGDIEKELRELEERIQKIEAEVAYRLEQVDKEFKRRKIQLFDIDAFKGDEINELLGILELDDRKPGKPKPTQFKYVESTSSFGLIRMVQSATFLAHSLRQIPANDKILEGLQLLSKRLGSVHIEQAVRHITSQYEAVHSRLEVGQQETYTGTNGMASSAVVSRKTRSFASKLSPLTRQPSEEEAKWAGAVQRLFGSKESQLVDELNRLGALARLAKRIKERGYTAVNFNETGEVELADVQSIVAKAESDTSNSLKMGTNAESIKVLSGPHGSGKTYYQKTIVPAILMAQTLGFAPASSATMPLFERVVYIDRVAQDQNAQISAGMQEVDYWKEVASVVKTDGLVFAAVDEAGSSTSAKYQAAFNAAIAHEFARLGHLLVMASHNHSAARAIVGTSGRAQGYHFDVSVVGETRFGGIIRSHRISSGLEESHAMEAAKEAGLPGELLRIIASS